MSSPLPEHLAELGRALNHAMRADVAAERSGQRRHRHARWLRNPRRAAVGVVVAAVAVPATAFAATKLITTHQVAAGIPRGTLALAGTHPSCTVVQAGVEYHCVLKSAPASVNTSSGTTHVQLERLLNEAGRLRPGPGGKSIRGLVVATVYIGHEHRTIYLKNGVRVELRPAGTPVPATNWKGYASITVDATKHVNGGCRSLNTKGTEWNCYLGQAAVQQHIIGPKLLGQYAPDPSVG